MNRLIERALDRISPPKPTYPRRCPVTGWDHTEPPYTQCYECNHSCDECDPWTGCAYAFVDPSPIAGFCGYSPADRIHTDMLHPLFHEFTDPR